MNHNLRLYMLSAGLVSLTYLSRNIIIKGDGAMAPELLHATAISSFVLKDEEFKDKILTSGMSYAYSMAAGVCALSFFINNSNDKDKNTIMYKDITPLALFVGCVAAAVGCAAGLFLSHEVKEFFRG